MTRRFAALVLLLAVLATACAVPRTSSPPREGAASSSRIATMYRSPTCTCCHEYEAILRAAGWSIEVVEIDDTAAFKTEHGIAREAWSCHTLAVDGYLVEGHVPLAAIDDMLELGQAIDGIALPGMPAGSPGMAGVAAGPFTILALQGGETAPFGTY
jgi:hypothetical protein